MRFLAAIRLILSRASGVDILNELAKDTIRKHILPVLREEEAAGDVGASELVEMYEDYLGSNSRSNIFGVQGFKVILNTAKMYNLDSDAVDELVMQFVDDFYRQKSWKKILKGRQKETVVDGGPEAFAKWFTGIVRLDAMSNARKWTTRNRSVRLTPREDEEGDPMERLPGGGDDPMEALVEKEVQRDLRKFIKRMFGRKPVYMELFDEWMDVVRKKGSRANVRKDVLSGFSDRLGIPEKTLYGYIKQMKKAMAEFFLREYNLRVPIAASSGMDMVDRVAYVEFRRRIAEWVLPREPLLRMLVS